MVTDPVCEMQIEEPEAVAKVEYRGRTYYFCSESCQKAFEKTPEQFVGTK